MINTVAGGLIDVSVCAARRLVIAQCRRGDYATVLRIDYHNRYKRIIAVCLCVICASHAKSEVDNCRDWQYGLVIHVIIKSMCSLLLAKGYFRVTETKTNAAPAQK